MSEGNGPLPTNAEFLTQAIQGVMDEAVRRPSSSVSTKVSDTMAPDRTSVINTVSGGKSRVCSCP